QRQKKTTLIPYTTLFRSNNNNDEGSGNENNENNTNENENDENENNEEEEKEQGFEVLEVGEGSVPLSEMNFNNPKEPITMTFEADRKSTRLNSSHVSISY